MSQFMPIIDDPNEVLDAAVAHAVALHGRPDTPELREQVKAAPRTEQPAWL